MDLVAIYIGDGYLYGASPDPIATHRRYWPVTGDEDTWVLAWLNDVPDLVANKLVAHGTSEQSYDDGYTAASAAAPYAGPLIDGEGWLWDQWLEEEREDNPSSCPPCREPGRVQVHRKGHMRKVGRKRIRIPPAVYCAHDRGKPGVSRAGKGILPFASIRRIGKLGGRGYAKRPMAERHRLLTKCVGRYGYRSCLGSVMILNRNSTIKPATRKVITADKNWLVKKYGGPGSFKKRRRNPEGSDPVFYSEIEAGGEPVTYDRGEYHYRVAIPADPDRAAWLHPSLGLVDLWGTWDDEKGGPGQWSHAAGAMGPASTLPGGLHGVLVRKAYDELIPQDIQTEMAFHDAHAAAALKLTPADMPAEQWDEVLTVIGGKRKKRVSPMKKKPKISLNALVRKATK